MTTISKPRKLQDIFNTVIDSGIYLNDTKHMCIALELAKGKKLITPEEQAIASEAIKNYLAYLQGSSYGLLADALIAAGIVADGIKRNTIYSESCLRIYRNWENKPMPRLLE